MATQRERFKVRNTLICLLKEVEGKTTTVELRNESSVSGLVEHVDGYMNVTMSSVCFRNYKGKISKFANFFVQGTNIRFVQIPDEIDMRKAIKYHATKDILIEKKIHEQIRNAALLKMKKKEQDYKNMLKKQEAEKRKQEDKKGSEDASATSVD